MTLIVLSERWCEMAVRPQQSGDCVRCGDVATALCDACGCAICDTHEKVCAICGGSCCVDCKHACLGGAPQRLAA